MQARGEIVQIIVVDDCATDGSAARVRAHPTVELARTPAQGGPGAARNLGATLATGSHLWFVDSDVIVADDAARVLRATLATTNAAAVIGSYDDRPAAGNFLSQYKNLVHHYYHHRGKAQASTFWGGCGAVERALFLRLGGFDAKRYRYPSIEDIEFGYRIGDAGARIVLEPRLQGKHLKEWRFVNLVHTEVFRRALPWTRLMLERKDVTNDLNVGFGERARAILALATMAAIAAWAVGLRSRMGAVRAGARGRGGQRKLPRVLRPRPRHRLRAAGIPVPPVLLRLQQRGVRVGHDHALPRPAGAFGAGARLAGRLPAARR